MPIHSYAGLDWGGVGHAVCIIDDAGGVIERFDARHDAEGIAELLRRLSRVAPAAEMPAAIERPSGLIVDSLVAAGYPGRRRLQARQSPRLRPPAHHPHSRPRLGSHPLDSLDQPHKIRSPQTPSRPQPRDCRLRLTQGISRARRAPSSGAFRPARAHVEFPPQARTLTSQEPRVPVVPPRLLAVDRQSLCCALRQLAE